MAAIDICLSHDSAFRWLMRNERIACTRQADGDELTKLSPPCGETAALLAQDLGLGPYCVDVLTGVAGRCCPGIATHRAAKDVSVLYWEVPISGYGQVRVTSPEETFVQLARTHSLLETVYMGFALCSNYRIEPYAPHGVVMRDASCGPLTSREKLLAFIDAHPRMHGTGKARRAVAYVRNGSNSPMESALAMGLGMPVVLGGFNVGLVAMSRRNRHRVTHSLTMKRSGAEDDAVLVVKGRKRQNNSVGDSRPFLIHLMGSGNVSRMPRSSCAVSLPQMLDYESYWELCMEVRRIFVRSASCESRRSSAGTGETHEESLCAERQREFWRLIVCMSDFRSAEFGASSPARVLPAAA